jgi:hypothetical protein
MLIDATLLGFLITASHVSFAQNDSPQYDLIIRHGTVYDGTGAGAVIQDIAVQGDRIAALGNLSRATGRHEVDATGLAVAPGFIDMLNHSESALIADGRSQSMIRQGVTLLVFGEGSMGPINERMKKYQTERQSDIKFDITWSTLGEVFEGNQLLRIEPRQIGLDLDVVLIAITSLKGTDTGILVANVALSKPPQLHTPIDQHRRIIVSSSQQLVDLRKHARTRPSHRERSGSNNDRSKPRTKIAKGYMGS